MRTVMIGSRGSRLALIQAEYVISKLKEAAPDFNYEIKIIQTSGDKWQGVGLAGIGGTGVFTKEIENALLSGEIDAAVHSMKDLPTTITAGLTIAAIMEREDPRDVLVAKAPVTLGTLPQGAMLGTGSLRRIAQLRYLRPDLVFEPLRGNLDTRLRKLDEGNYSGLLLAFAGMKRMGWERYVTQVFSFDTCLPAAGQGALGVEIRSDDQEIAGLLLSLDHLPTHAAVLAERAFLGRVGGGCHVPIGALAEVNGNEIHLRGIIAALDGSKLLRGEEVGSLQQAKEVGIELGERLLSKGGGAILE
ncbi:MAG: hydroxymethylbilane synthase [Bacillota bacterium]|nr:hydroxymethylbilane synthase [Bacillota bacterium]